MTFLTEPEAAAIHDDQRDPLTVGSFVAVYDFGGGTFDAAILRKTETGFEEVGTSEEMEHLGGIDFDEAFSSSVVGFVSANGIAVDADDPATAAALVRLRDEGRRAKEALSSEPETTVHVDLPGFETELPLTREDFEDLIRPPHRRDDRGVGPGHRERGFHIPRAGPGPAHRWVVTDPVGGRDGRRGDGPSGHDRCELQGFDRAGGCLRRRAATTGCCDGRRGGCGGGRGGRHRFDPWDGGGVRDGRVSLTRRTPLRRPRWSRWSPSPRQHQQQAVAPAAQAAAVAGAADTTYRRRTIASAAALGGLVLVLLLAAGASGMLSGAASSSPPASDALVSSAPAVEPSASPTPLTSGAPTSTPLPSSSALASPSATPAGRQARITGIAVSDGRYVVDYQTFGYTPSLPGTHMHFFFDTVSVPDAGVPGAGPWFLYAGPAPFTGYKVSDKPADASQMCILVANPDHSIIPDTGNCMDLPLP